MYFFFLGADFYGRSTRHLHTQTDVYNRTSQHTRTEEPNKKQQTSVKNHFLTSSLLMRNTYVSGNEIKKGAVLVIKTNQTINRRERERVRPNNLFHTPRCRSNNKVRKRKQKGEPKRVSVCSRGRRVNSSGKREQKQKKKGVGWASFV